MHARRAAVRRLGGVTGDVLGATVEAALTAGETRTQTYTVTVDDGQKRNGPPPTFRIALTHDGTEAEADAF